MHHRCACFIHRTARKATTFIPAMAVIAAISTATVLLLGGCFFRDLKKEVAGYEAAFALVGQVRPASTDWSKVIVVLFASENGQPTPMNYTFPDHAGHFSFLVNAGTYTLGAFADENDNLRHDPGEVAGFYGAPDTIVVTRPPPGPTASKSRQHLDIQLTPTDRFAGGLDITVGSAFEQVPLFKAGVIKPLDDPRFDPANGKTGYLKPLTFLQRFGMGIYFSEAYDPRRIPVLFVHGANGTPRGWEAMAARLNSQRYQAWFFYYPSGIRLDAAARTLQSLVQVLHTNHGFDRLYIIAHSMGGLVARAAILTNAHQYGRDYVKLFIALSTPWGGIAMAQRGVEQSPGVIPSWHDVAPGSDFIRELYRLPLSPEIPFHLFFSHKGNCSLFMANNDGTVELASALDYRAQADAAGIYGFYDDHDSILTSQAVLDRYLMILDASGR